MDPGEWAAVIVAIVTVLGVVIRWAAVVIGTLKSIEFNTQILSSRLDQQIQEHRALQARVERHSDLLLQIARGESGA